MNSRRKQSIKSIRNNKNNNNNNNNNNTNYGFMAHRRRNNNTLECHYCGTRSDVQKDGTFKKWECESCTAMNYHDQHGEVVDPPTHNAPINEQKNSVQYAQTPCRPGPAASRKVAEEPLFCNQCLRNQRLFTESLAQYLPDDSDPDYEALYKNYYKFRRNLEKRYPQICTDCEPRVTARMEQAGYIAKTDHLQRLLNKSKERRFLPGPSYKFSWASLFDFTGMLLWYWGLSVQILWNVLGCFGSGTATMLASFVSQPEVAVVIPYLPTPLVLPPAIVHFCSLSLPYLYSGDGVPPLASVGLWWSFLSLWWNPVYKDSVRGFNEHITGYHDWYKMQVTSLVFRFAFFALMKRGWFGYGDAVTLRAAHSFLIIITIITSLYSYKAISIDHSRIFVVTPEKLKKYAQPKAKSEDTPSDVSIQLFSRNPKPQPIYNQPLFPHSAPKTQAKKNVDFNNRPPLIDSYIHELNSRSRPPHRYKSFQPNHSFRSPSQEPAASPLAAKDREELANLEDSLRCSRGIPVRISPQRQLLPGPHEQSPLGESSGMDWEPIDTPVRAFQTAPTTRGAAFGQSPAGPPEQRGVFWYHVPPAPRSQNAKLRNPTAPGFVSASGATKENFFQSMGGSQRRVFDMEGDDGDGDGDEVGGVDELALAPPTFFGPQAADDGLADLMSQSFSLQERVEKAVEFEEEEKGRRWWHFSFVFLLAALLLAYMYYFRSPGYEAIYEELVRLSGRGQARGEALAVGRDADVEL